MISNIERIPIWRACDECRLQRRRCRHKRPALLSPRGGGPGGGPGSVLQLATDSKDTRLAVSPNIRRRPKNKRQRVVGGEETKKAKRVAGNQGEGGEGEEEDGEGEGEKDDEIYGTIAVRQFPVGAAEYSTFRRPDGSPHIGGRGVVKESGKGVKEENVYLERSDVEGGKVGGEAEEENFCVEQPEVAEEDIEEPSFAQTVDRSGIDEESTTTNEHRRNRDELVDAATSIDEIAEAREMDEKTVTHTTVTTVTAVVGTQEIVDEDNIQRAIARAIAESNSQDSVVDTGGTRKSLEEEEETPRQPTGQKEIVTIDDDDGDDELEQLTYHESFHRDDTESEPERELNHPSLHNGDDAESEPESEHEPPLESHVPPSPPPPLHPQRPPLPLTPASFNPTPPPPSSTPITGPARWRNSAAKRSRFSGPKIYTPLTLHPPTMGLGVVDLGKMPPPVRGVGDTRWEGAKRGGRDVDVEDEGE